MKDLLLTLVSYSLDGVLSCLGVQVFAGANRREVLIQLVVEGDTGGNVQTGDVLIRNTLKVLNQGTQGVTVRSDQNVPICQSP